MDLAGFSATVKGISLFEFVQLIVLTKKSKMIEVKNNQQTGVLEIENGKIIFAITNQKKGTEAFFEIMGWENGAFKELKLDKKIKSNIEDDGSLLIDLERSKKGEEMLKSDFQEYCEATSEIAGGLLFRNNLILTKHCPNQECATKMTAFINGLFQLYTSTFSTTMARMSITLDEGTLLLKRIDRIHAALLVKKGVDTTPYIKQLDSW